MSRVVKNIIYNLLGQSATLVLSFVAVRFIFRRLGDDAFGLIYFNVLLTSVVLSVLELGVSATTVREVSSRLDEEPAYVRDLIRTTSSLYWGLYAIAAVLIFFGAPLLVSHWITLHRMDGATATAVLRILSIAGALTLPRLLYASVIRGRQRMEFTNAIDVGTSIFMQAGTVVILSSRGGLFQVVGWIALSYALGTLAYVLVAARFFGWGALVPGYSGSVVRRNLVYTSHAMASTLLGLIHSQVATILVSRLVPIGTFGLYSLGVSLAGRATLVNSAVSQASLPSLSNLHRAHDLVTLVAQTRKLVDLLALGTVPIFAAVVFAILPVIGFVFDPSMAGQLLLPAALLCLGYYLNGTLVIPYILAFAAGRPQIVTRVNLAGLFVVLPVTAVLVFSLGILGAGLSWVVYNLYLAAVMVPLVYRQCLESSPAEWYLLVARVAGQTLLCYGLAWLVAGIFDRNLASLAATYLVATAAYLAIGYLSLGSDLRGTLRRLPGQLTARRA